MKDENKRCNPWARFSGLRSTVLLAGLIALLSGCAGPGEKDGPGNWAGDAEIADAVPKTEPRSRYGNPDSYVVFGKRYKTKASATGHFERGVASWYGKKFHGRRTSSGERYDMYAMTAAHKTLPLPTYAKVTNLENGRSTVVRINDRGPFHGDRVIDLSYAAATKLGVVRTGTAFVEVKAIDPSRPASKQAEENLFVDAGKASGGKSRGTGGAVVARGTPSTQERRGASPMGSQVAQRSAVAETKRNASPAKEIQVAKKASPATAKPSAKKSGAEIQVARADTASKSERKVAAVSEGHAATGKAASSLYLQVGAFGNRTNAEQLRRQLLQQLAERVRVRTSDGGEAPLYKVHVGPFESRQKARSVSQQIASLGLREFHVVTE